MTEGHSLFTLLDIDSSCCTCQSIAVLTEKDEEISSGCTQSTLWSVLELCDSMMCEMIGSSEYRTGCLSYTLFSLAATVGPAQ